MVLSDRVRVVGYQTPLQTALCFMVFGQEVMIKPMSETLLTKTVGFRVSEGSPTLKPQLLGGGGGGQATLTGLSASDCPIVKDLRYLDY